MKSCLSIAPRSMQEALSAMKAFSSVADLIELRTDGMSDLDLSRLLKKPRPELIITNRRHDEGGAFRGTAEEQFQVLGEALSRGAEYVDAELIWGGELLRRLKSVKGRGRLIVSSHDDKKTPPDLTELYQRARRAGADIIKIAVTANDIADNKQLFLLLERARLDRQPLVAIALGERGTISRILAKKYGNHFNYLAINPEHATAGGQLTLAEAKNVYPLRTMNSRTKIFGLVGNPVAHSRGIYFHNDIFRRRSLNAVYVNFLVDDLPSFLRTYRADLAGFSVTIPFKCAILPWLDSVEGGAESIGAVNTVLIRGGKLTGHNTDYPAILSLLRKKKQLRGRRVLILGSGGTSRTMVHAAASLGAKVTISGRSPERTRELASELGTEWVEFSSLAELHSDALLNGTSVGIDPGADEELLPEGFFKKNMLVFDAVYSPVGTRLIRTAEASGCITITGDELFREQALRQSRLFLGMIR